MSTLQGSILSTRLFSEEEASEAAALGETLRSEIEVQTDTLTLGNAGAIALVHAGVDELVVGRHTVHYARLPTRHPCRWRHRPCRLAPNAH